MSEKESDKMFTVIIPGEPKKGEPIPSREKSAGEAVAARETDIKENKNIPEHPELYDHHLSKLLKKPTIPQYISSQTIQPSPDVENAILGLNKNPLKRNFYELALKNVNNAVENATEVPFMCYWPTYDAMTAAQQQWYFYWRDRVRQGEYPETDLSYIFVHAYELLNNIGVRDGADGYRQLRALWLGYRERDRDQKLDNYLPDWMADYAVINRCNIDPVQPYVDLSCSTRRCPNLI
jgi:hypothetical protein